MLILHKRSDQMTYWFLLSFNPTNSCKELNCSCSNSTLVSYWCVGVWWLIASQSKPTSGVTMHESLANPMAISFLWGANHDGSDLKQDQKMVIRNLIKNILIANYFLQCLCSNSLLHSCHLSGSKHPAQHYISFVCKMLVMNPVT